MSVRKRLEEALLLWENGKAEGAWIQVLSAVAAIAKQRYPNSNIKDNYRFKEYIRDVSPQIYNPSCPPISGGGRVQIILGSDTNQNKMPLEDLIYTHMRCYLFHEACLSESVGLSRSRIVNGKLSAQLVVGKTHMIPDFWVLNLAKAAAESPENAEDCTGLSFNNKPCGTKLKKLRAYFSR
jgi:hypothetical protein